MTTRGMTEKHMVKIADFVDRSIRNRESESELAKIKAEVEAMAEKFPVPGIA
jgi:glycine hydroxymethyltransferase